MEPSSAEDGDISAVDRVFQLDWASMEPSSAEDGDVPISIHCLCPSELQWSRPQQRTETSDAGLEATRQLIASMEPSSAEDGDAGRWSDDNRRLLRLQWSRPQQRTETPGVGPSGCGSVRASMEPSSAEDGDHTSSSGDVALFAASMEPSSAEDGDPA